MRYHGGKFRIAAEIVALMPAHDVYVECFGGAASVLLAKSPCACEIYNDACGDVVNVFRQLRDSSDALLRGLFLTPYARDEYFCSYEPTSDPLEAARRFIFRIMAGLGSDASRRVSSFRTSLDDGKYAHARSWAGMPDALALVCERLRNGVIIENEDAQKLMLQFDSDRTLHYVDPPYIGETRKTGKRGYTHEMLSIEEHESLLDCVVALDGKVIVSGYPHALYDKWLGDWTVRDLQQRDQRNNHRVERVWMNFQPEDLLL